MFDSMSPSNKTPASLVMLPAMKSRETFLPLTEEMAEAEL